MNDRERRLRALETGRGSRPPSYEVVWEESHIEAEIDEMILWYTRGYPESELPARYREDPPEPGVFVIDTSDPGDLFKTPYEQAKAEAKWYAERPDIKHESEITQEAEEAF
jgi:hypothetical protein